MIRKISKKVPAERLNVFLKKYGVNTRFFAINRRLVARAVMIGLFFSLLPVPLQMLMVVLMTALVRFNILIALSIVLLTNPLTMPFIIYAEYQLGSFLLQQDVQVQIQLSMAWVQEHYDLILIPLFAGALSAAAFLAAASYFIVDRLWVRSARKAHAARSCHLKAV